MRISKEQFLPFFLWLPLVNRSTLKADLIAGITGAVVVLPQGVAFAMIAGLPPQYGLYTAMVTPIVAALFGSSRHLISGPTTAISIVVFSSVSRYADAGTAEFVSLALTMTFMAGVFQFVSGVARLGTVVNFVSHTVVVGFTAGAAVLIATSQVKNMLGVLIPKGETFLLTWVDLWEQLGSINYSILAVALTTLITAILVKRIAPSLPNLLIALIVGGGAAQIIGGEGGGIPMVGEIPNHLPPLSMPDFSFSSLTLLAPQSLAVALLGLIEAVSISRAIASKSHQRIDSNQEFIGQGLSNIISSFFSSYAGSGSFTRSGVNYSAGAKTPISAIFAAGFLMAIVLLIAPLAVYLPMSAMAGVILLVAYNLVDFKQIRHILESSKTETSIFLTTLGATLFLELEFAIYLGILLSLMIFLGRTSFPKIVSLAPHLDPVYGKKKLVDLESRPLKECPNLKIIRMDMSIYFGSINHLQTTLRKISKEEGINHILVIGSGINLIDLSGTEVLHSEADRLASLGGGLYFAKLKPGVYEAISRTHFFKDIGNTHFFDETQQAIGTLQRLLRKQGRCKNCTAQVFDECMLRADKEE